MSTPSPLAATNRWIQFLAMVSLLIGLFATGRIIINHLVLTKYPTTGVLQIASFPAYGQREEDCDFSMPYFAADGTPREAFASEMTLENQQKERCLAVVAETRHNAFIQDLGSAAFFVFVGGGLWLWQRRTS